MLQPPPGPAEEGEARETVRERPAGDGASATVAGHGAARRAQSRAAAHRRRVRRALLSLLAIAVVLVVGSIGFAITSGTGAVNSFYFESMLATGQGPPFPLTTVAGKLFASFMAFVSVGTVISALILNVGPFIERLWRDTVDEIEREARVIRTEVAHEFEGKGR